MAATEAPRREAAPGTRPSGPGAPGRPADEEPPDDQEQLEEEPPETQPGEADEEDDEAGEKKPPDLNALLDAADPATLRALRKNSRLMGVLGEQGRRDTEARARELASQMVQDQYQRERAERSRQEVLAKARSGDYYAIGEQAARDALQQDQQASVDQFTRRAESQTYQKVQSALEEWASTQPEEVNQRAAERMGELPEGTPWEQGFRKWLDAYVQVRAEHLAAQPETRQRAERELTPAVKARVLAEMNGKEPTADSGSGRPQRVRKITDEDIARMDLDEYMQVWDVDKGRPKPGVQYTPTRGIDPRSMRMLGRGV
jgi:hypothetical protein